MQKIPLITGPGEWLSVDISPVSNFDSDSDMTLAGRPLQRQTVVDGKNDPL